MKLDEFVLQDRGPRLIDVFVHPEKIKTPIGDFGQELIVEMDAKPTQEMVNILKRLSVQLSNDKNLITELVYKQYQDIFLDSGWAEFALAEGVESGLSKKEFIKYLSDMVVSVGLYMDEMNSAVYLSPQWDNEHGLYLEYIGNNWEVSPG